MKTDTIINFDNFDSFTHKEIADFIYAKMEEEVKKDEKEMDCDLLKEGSLLLRQLQGKEEIKLGEERLRTAWDKINKKYERRKKEASQMRMPSEKRKNYKKIFLVAALVALLMVASAVAVGANEPFVSYCENLFGISFKDLFKHDTYTDGNITYINQNTEKSKRYNSIEEFAKEECIVGLCFPEKLEVKKIIYSKFEGTEEIVFNPVNQTELFSINVSTKDQYGLDFNPPNYEKVKTQNGIDVWIVEKESYTLGTGSTQVMFKINQWYYCISTSCPDETVKLIDDFKEIS